MEQQLASGLGEGQVAELVEDDEVAPGQLIGEPALAAGAGFGLEPVDRYCQVVRRVPQVGGRRCSGGHFGGVGAPQTEGISSGMAV